MRLPPLCAMTISMAALCWTDAHAQRQMERLDRGLVAINQGKDDGVFLSWRLLGTEPRELGFNVYRQIQGSEPVKLNDRPLTAGTNFSDHHPDFDKPTLYFVRPVEKGIEGKSCKPFMPVKHNFVARVLFLFLHKLLNHSCNTITPYHRFFKIPA